jgi:hypothetical protein
METRRTRVRPVLRKGGPGPGMQPDGSCVCGGMLLGMCPCGKDEDEEKAVWAVPLGKGVSRSRESPGNTAA